MEKISFFMVSGSALSRVLYGNMFSRESEIKLLGSSRPNLRFLEKIYHLKPDIIAVDGEERNEELYSFLVDLQQKEAVRFIFLTEDPRTVEEHLPMSLKRLSKIIRKPANLDSEEMRTFKGLFYNTIMEEELELVKYQEKPPLPLAVKEPSRPSGIRECGQHNRLICIGTSTGGPKALQTVLSNLPASIAAPIAIVQHMPPNFTKSLANRLDSICAIQVKEAEDGEDLCNGVAYIAPGGCHLTFEQTESQVKVKIIDSQPVNGHRPSVDVMFSSAGELTNLRIMAVVMTGMGADGARGLVKMKENGNVWAIAESEESCIVYGMPKAAVQTKKIDSVEKLDQIAPAIMKFLK